MPQPRTFMVVYSEQAPPFDEPVVFSSSVTITHYDIRVLVRLQSYDRLDPVRPADSVRVETSNALGKESWHHCHAFARSTVGIRPLFLPSDFH